MQLIICAGTVTSRIIIGFYVGTTLSQAMEYNRLQIQILKQKIPDYINAMFVNKSEKKKKWIALLRAQKRKIIFFFSKLCH